MWFILNAFCIQFLFLVSVFDIHFQSPVIHGMPSFSVTKPPPAKRLVLISADGLRVDTFRNLGNDLQPNAPFLRLFFIRHNNSKQMFMNNICYLHRSIASSRGKWGVSHTRVPTESRPGHVAMIAGLYEDPSAVFKVLTIINRSRQKSDYISLGMERKPSRIRLCFQPESIHICVGQS
jgi:GPI ethanolamine phosphate transferase 1